MLKNLKKINKKLLKTLRNKKNPQNSNKNNKNVCGSKAHHSSNYSLFLTNDANAKLDNNECDTANNNDTNQGTKLKINFFK